MPKRTHKFEPSQMPALFSEELQTLQEDISRRAALAVLDRIRFTNATTLGDFLAEMKQRKDLWAVLTTVGVVDFAKAICGVVPGQAEDVVEPRTRISESQKQGLKDLVLKTLQTANVGLNRKDLAARFSDNELDQLGLPRNDKLADKLRQPLLELLREKSIRSEGEKRLLVYLMPENTPARRGKGKKAAADEATP